MNVEMNVNNQFAQIGEQINLGNIEALNELDLDSLFEPTKEEVRSEVISMWVTPSVAEKVKEYEDNIKEREKIVLQYLNKGKKQLKFEINYIKQSLGFYKELTDNLKSCFEKVEKEFKESLQEIYATTEEDYIEMCRRNIDFIDKVENSVNKAKEKMKDLQTSVRDCNVYGADKLLEVVERFSRMFEKEKDLLSKLLNVEK
jgi:hypothetical protein|nr:MAG TPA: hypothetical protein [Caudoviricetes sp.]